MYSSEDLEIKCKSNTMKLASFVEMQPLLSKDFISSIKPRRCLMANRYRVFVKEQSSLQHFFEMVQGHTQNRDKGRWQTLRLGKKGKRSVKAVLSA